MTQAHLNWRSQSDTPWLATGSFILDKMFISQVWDQIKISDMCFAAELVFSRSVLKAEPNFDLIPDLRDLIYQLNVVKIQK